MLVRLRGITIRRTDYFTYSSTSRRSVLCFLVVHARAHVCMVVGDSPKFEGHDPPTSYTRQPNPQVAPDYHEPPPIPDNQIPLVGIA